MRRTLAIVPLLLLLFVALATGRGRVEAPSAPDSLSGLHLYTEGIKQRTIARDNARALALFQQAVAQDSTLAPAYYELTLLSQKAPQQALDYARRAYALDSTNRWYHQALGHSLIMADRYKEALDVYRSLQKREPQEPDHYRILAALYEQNQNPYMAIATLDSAELRFGRIPLLSQMKRRLLVATHQRERALSEAQELVKADPYEVEHRVVLAELYHLAGNDSLARVEYDQALKINPSSLKAIFSKADFHQERKEWREMMALMQPIFAHKEMDLPTKLRYINRFTADVEFYRQYYLQINALINTLALLYPDNPEVVKIHAQHLIRSGELEQALTLYKSHLSDEPPVEEYFEMVVDIESYQKQADSVRHYASLALKHFPRNLYFRLANGNLALSLGQSDEAIKVYLQALPYADTDSLRGVIWGSIGDAWHQKAEQIARAKDSLSAAPKLPKKEVKACYKAYDKSLHYWSDNALVLNNYAYFLSEENRELERAFEMSSRALELSDRNATYLDTHAWVLYRLGRYEEAKRYIQQAVAFDDTQSGEILLHYGDILSAMGERFLAEIYWRKALEAGYHKGAIEARFAPKTNQP